MKFLSIILLATSFGASYCTETDCKVLNSSKSCFSDIVTSLSEAASNPTKAEVVEDAVCKMVIAIIEMVDMGSEQGFKITSDEVKSVIESLSAEQKNALTKILTESRIARKSEASTIEAGSCCKDKCDKCKCKDNCGCCKSNMECDGDVCRIK